MKETKQIKQSRRDVRGVLSWLTEVEEAIIDGYRIDKEDRSAKTGPRTAPYLSVWLHKGEEVVVVSESEENKVPPLPEAPLTLTPHTEVTGDVTPDTEEKPYDILEDVKAKKADLLKWAEENGKEVPEDLKAPAAIRKHLKSIV